MSIQGSSEKRHPAGYPAHNPQRHSFQRAHTVSSKFRVSLNTWNRRSVPENIPRYGGDMETRSALRDTAGNGCGSLWIPTSSSLFGGRYGTNLWVSWNPRLEGISTQSGPANDNLQGYQGLPDSCSSLLAQESQFASVVFEFSCVQRILLSK